MNYPPCMQKNCCTERPVNHQHLPGFQMSEWVQRYISCSLNILTRKPMFFNQPSTCIEFQTTRNSKRKWAKQCDSFYFVGYSPYKSKTLSKPTLFYISPHDFCHVQAPGNLREPDHQTIYIITHQKGPHNADVPREQKRRVEHPSAREPLVRNNTV